MLVRFDTEKAIQAAAVLLKTTECRHMSRLRLIKLLYIADREAIEETGAPITGDKADALPHGPVLSRIYDAIKGAGYDAPRWAQFIRGIGPQDLALIEDPGVLRLSRFEVRKLQEVAHRYGSWDDWALAEHTHEFEEWQKHSPAAYNDGQQSHPIPTRDILVALGFGDRADELIEEAKELRKVDRLLARATML